MSSEKQKKINFGFTGGSERLTKISVRIGQWWYIAVSTIGLAIISIAASLCPGSDIICKLCSSKSVSGILFTLKNNLTDPYIFLILGLLLVWIGNRGIYIDLYNLNEKNKELDKENSKFKILERKMRSVIEDSEYLQNTLYDHHIQKVEIWLKSTFNILKLNTHDRISIYYCIQDSFNILTRHSQNPIFNKIHRQKFNISKSVIAQAWGHRECIDIDDCPEYNLENSQKYKEYMMLKYSYDGDKVDRLTMKSCQFAAFSILEADSSLGVIVFETETKGRFDIEKVKKIKDFCIKYQSYMVTFIQDAIKYDKSAQVRTQPASKVDQDFLSYFEEG